MLVVFASCSGGGSSGHKKDAVSFEQALEASTGQAHTVVKLNSKVPGYVVYQNNATGEFVAYNMERWDRATMTTMDQFNAVALAGDVVANLDDNREWIDSGYWSSIYETDYDYVWDDFCECYETVETEVYVGQEWVDTSSWVTFYYGGGMRFDNASTVSRDLDTIAALKDDAAEAFIATRLQSEFSLSSHRASELAKLTNRYQKLENSRELTTSEKDRFAMDALGVSMTRVESALRAKAEGNERAYEQLLETAARVNSTTPEQIGRFFDEMATLN